ncbi:MAG: methylenetetrahydrofolate reductase [NAD(P)H] [Actinomycetota bacterium]|nr:methylenetetrahydrofolate reductase [NAD(P)H] [Actinomycetota bacterium]
MKLHDIYARDGHTFSFEFFPPKTDEGVDKLFAEVEVLKTLNPAFCSVTYGAGGSTQGKTVEIVSRVHDDAGLEAMCHLTIVNQPKSQVRGVLQQLRDNGLENIIALAGDPPDGVEVDWTAHPDGFLHSRELVEEARAFEDDWFSVAVAGFPEVHPRAVSRESDLKYLKEKVDAGATAVVTQLFYDNEDFYRYVEDVRAVGIEVPIVPGIMPVLSAPQIRRFTSMCHSKIPPRLGELLDKVEDDNEAATEMGIEYATEQVQGLLDFGIPGIHFYSLNRSRSVKAIFENCGLQELQPAVR